jgi:hypothetical protein
MGSPAPSTNVARVAHRARPRTLPRHHDTQEQGHEDERRGPKQQRHPEQCAGAEHTSSPSRLPVFVRGAEEQRHRHREARRDEHTASPGVPVVEVPVGEEARGARAEPHDARRDARPRRDEHERRGEPRDEHGHEAEEPERKGVGVAEERGERVEEQEAGRVLAEAPLVGACAVEEPRTRHGGGERLIAPEREKEVRDADRDRQRHEREIDAGRELGGAHLHHRTWSWKSSFPRSSRMTKRPSTTLRT